MTRIELERGDITAMAVDVIVNAANSALAGGGGVDGAIHRAAGPELKAASLAQAPCPTGEARITPGFRLPARFVVHTVGPVWSGGGREEAALLARCYRRSLDLAAEAGARSIAFPAISTGVYGYPREAAARVAVDAVRGWVEAHPDAFDRVVLVAFSAEDERALDAAL
ncbi:O-acetyl-ADP-ribose deacetylase [Sphingomonas oligoaromativorans]|uniref:O-acetyl-ADP-ribose deacetylase n=1 Tax=Sphingomonas oligoaromativorans TaxID=575322 RepID=UPI00141DF54F|nr:O-acetyl-ADP-ribose deacetylase [Sphingomonas oligoaromativorans]NIJ34851.1 O-acetyl-ADP-ribose deacetylase (regulator of RNase III) [Sphingomonas oligoaromativorans]